MVVIFVVLGVLAVILLSTVIFITHQYKRCPSNRILVVYGKTGTNSSAKCIHGGGTFVLPLIQDYAYLSLVPMTADIDLKGALSNENIRVNVPSLFTIAISTKPELRILAAERLLGLNTQQILGQAEDIIVGQLRLVIASLSIKEINQDREKFLERINENVNMELNKLGLEVINVNIRDITDQSGYIDAIGQKAAAEAINKAKIEVAEQEKTGAIGQAEAHKTKETQVAQRLAEKEIGIAEANRTQQVQVASANAQLEIGVAEAQKQQRINTAKLEAEAIESENDSKAKIAEYNSNLVVKQAEAQKKGELAKAEAQTKILEAQKQQEISKLGKEELAKIEVQKQAVEIEAQATAQKIKIEAEAQAEAVRLKYAAEAEGINKVLEAKAEGYKKLVQMSEQNPSIAASFLMIESLPKIVEKQTDAIKNLKIDKIVVWDSGNEQGTTANFVKQFGTALPPLQDLAKLGGVKLPDFLGEVPEEHKQENCKCKKGTKQQLND